MGESAHRWRATVAVAIGAAVAGLGAPVAQAQPAVGLLSGGGGNALATFDTDAPGVLTGTRAVTGLVGAERLVGIDERWQAPAGSATGAGLYGLGIDSATGVSHLYRLDPATGAATAVGAGFTRAPGARYGIDVNPVTDRLRVVTDGDDNYRIDIESGAYLGADSALSPSGHGVAAVAHDRVGLAPGTGQTTLYAVDPILDVLSRLGGPDGNPSPNGGGISQVGSLGVDASPAGLGLDIAPDGTAFATLTVGGVPGLYRVDLATGAATKLGTFTQGFTGFTIVPAAPSPTASPSPVPTTTASPAPTAIDSSRTGLVVVPTPTATPTPESIAPTNPLTLTASVASTYSRAAFLKGVRVRVATNERASVTGVVAIKPRRATAARATEPSYDLRVGVRTLPDGDGSRLLVLRPKKALFGSPSAAVRVQVRVTATDAAGWSRTVSKVITVKR